MREGCYEGFYGSSYVGDRSINITKADLKELYFKYQEFFPLEKYVNEIKEV